ncbi:nuclear transport factor 2 family protein [Furfurilactobacillus curtus]|uniref:SnoaL-like domain-containing protein n=1 Tax=Furfurilactobacillus curtus TaxID=1746200 RepID=A0ABQ5JRK3_9LACO
MTNELIGRRWLIKQANRRQWLGQLIDDRHLSCSMLGESDQKEHDAVVQLQIIANGVYYLTWFDADHWTTLMLNFNAGTMSQVSGGERGDATLDYVTGTVQLLNDNGTPNLQPFTNRQIVIAFWNAFFNRHDITAVQQYVAADLVQHNPSIADGAEAMVHYYRPLFGPQGSLRQAYRTIVSVADNDDLVYLHVIRRDQPEAIEMAEVDVFRVREGQIVEHWMVKQPFPNHSANGHPMF